MKHLSIDIETYSDIDLGKSGVYKYVQSPNFQILLFAYSIDGAEPEIVDLAQGEAIPAHIIAALSDPNVLKQAFNAAFEIACLSKFYLIIPKQWHCTMVHAYYLRYSGGLANVNEQLQIPANKAKDRSGRALIQYFSVPCKPTKRNGGRTRNYPYHDPEKWELFKTYCKQDVVAEMAIAERLAPWPMPEKEWDLWHLDQQINSFGIAIDVDLVKHAISIDASRREELETEARALTGLKNPNSVAQLKDWLEKETGSPVDTLRKEDVRDLLQETNCEKVSRGLEIRQELGKTSVSKYQAMHAAVGIDGRVRGLLQFYGAGTGRWAGRLVQVQNLPRNQYEGEMLDLARTLLKSDRVDGIELVYGDVQDTLSQLIRTAFIPTKGNRFVVADFSAIEARVIAWLAGETWRQEVFATSGKIYEASAAQMFGVPIETIVPGHENYALRRKGKVAELALGYQGSSGALIQMGALDMGLTEEELPEIVQLWRNRSPRIVDLWYALGAAAVTCVSTGQPQTTHRLTFRLEASEQDSYMTIELPSGRKLFYARPYLLENQWGQPQIGFYNLDQYSRKWERCPTYGGKLTENVVQAIARDCLAVALLRIEHAGFQTVMHIHDEVVLDVPAIISREVLPYICDLLSEPIDWAPGLILKAAGFESEYYKKD